MLRTHGDEDSFTYSKEVHLQNLKSTKQNDAISTRDGNPTKTMHRQVNSGDVIKASQSYKRSNSPLSSLQYYPALRYRAIPKEKIAKFQRHSENKRKYTADKKSAIEVYGNNEKLFKQAPEQIESQIKNM